MGNQFRQPGNRRLIVGILRMFKKIRKWVIFLTLLSVLIVFFFPSEKVKEWTCAYKIGQNYCRILIQMADDKKEYDKEKKYLEISARYGNPVAQRQLGLMYGIDLVEKDYQKSIYWLKKSLEHNEDKLSLAALGYYYKNGLGVEQDYVKAFELLRKSAEKGYDIAQFELGSMYAYGLGVESNDVKAVEWYRKSAEQGNANAQLSLGFMYTKGRGVKQDYEQANQWFKKSADQNNAQAQYNLGVSYDHGSGVEQNYKIAFQWYKKAAEQEYADAQHNIGVMYEYGKGVEKNLTKAKEYYQKAYNYYQKACINGVGAEKSCERLKELSNSIKRL